MQLRVPGVSLYTPTPKLLLQAILGSKWTFSLFCSIMRCFCMFSIYFGVPGSGKTTFAAYLVSRNVKKGIKTYSNVPIVGSYYLNPREVLGIYSIRDCDLILDEASIEFNNRAYKSFPQHMIQWFKLYRHYGVRNVYVFSQSYDDMDVTLRRLADRLFVITQPLRGLHVVRRIVKSISIDDVTHQIIDRYSMPRFGLRLLFGRPFYKLFDSWSAPALPELPENAVVRVVDER